jgi:DNA-directed RNA polymerase subunit E'/Rpb7
LGGVAQGLSALQLLSTLRIVDRQPFSTALVITVDIVDDLKIFCGDGSNAVDTINGTLMIAPETGQVVEGMVPIQVSEWEPRLTIKIPLSMRTV